jgi:hypothetical protein
MMFRQTSKSAAWSPALTVEGWKTPAGITPMTPSAVATFAALRLCRTTLASVLSCRMVSVLTDSRSDRMRRSNGSPTAF